MTLMYKRIGWGYFGYTWPLGWQGSIAIFELYDDRIVLKIFPFKKVVKLSEIDHIKKGHFMPVSTGIKIIHHGKGVDNIQFGCFNRDGLIDILEQMGIRVSK